MKFLPLIIASSFGTPRFSLYKQKAAITFTRTHIQKQQCRKICWHSFVYQVCQPKEKKVKWRSSLNTFRSHFLVSGGYELTVAGSTLSNPSFTDSLAGAHRIADHEES